MANKYLNDTGLGHFWDKTAYKYGVEYIVGTQSSATNVWTGVTLDKNCVNGSIPTGKVVVYKLPYAGNNSNATLNLTFPDGSTTGNIGIRNNASSGVTTHYGAGCNIFMVFDGTYWKCSSWYDSNNYDRIRHNANVKAASAVTAGQIIVGTDAGYKPAVNGATFSINYPILYAGGSISSGATNNNTYDVYPSVNLQNTKSGYTGTTYKMVFLVGTLSGTTFTVNSDIFTQAIPASVDNKVYAPIGLMTDSSKTIFFSPTNIYWEYRNGTFRPIANVPTLATVATSGSYNDLSNKPTIPAAQVQSNWTQTTTTAVDYIKNKPTLATVATSGSYNDLSNKPTIPTVNNATLTIQKNGSTVKTFTANASSDVTANITVPTNTNELTNGAGFITSSGSITGNAATATKLETARTIGIGTGATGTATSFNGTANITIPITDVKESYVSWGGKQLTNNMISPDDMGCIDEFGHNKLAFLPASCIDVAYTTDGGSTWVDYGLTDAQKVKMVTTSGVNMYVGGSSDNATANNIANLKLRVRIAAGPTSGGKVYTAAKKLLINFSGQGAGGSKVQIRHRTIANYIAGTDTWINVGTYDIAGGSGWNSYPYVSTFGGSFTSQTGQIGQLEFIFYCTTLGTWGLKKPCAIDFRMIGATNWTMPSELARAGHIYTFDENQVTTFPADVITVGRVYPSADNSKDLGTGSKRWKDVYLSGALKNNTYTWSLPSKTGTVALTSDIPSVPTVNNGTLTIQKNGSNVQTFTANQSTNVTANITVPTKISDLTNTSGGFVTYCTCATAAATAAKVVTLDSGDSNWVLRKGDIIAVKFTNTNTASSVTLNVNSTGAKSIWYNNAAYTGSSNAITGYANRYLFYLYDGTNWVWFSDGRHDGNDNTYTTAYCSTASGTAAKGASMTGYVLTANRYTVITFTNANTYAGAVTLNINSKGAKPLYIDGKASSSTNYAFAAGSYIVWYDGTNYYLTTNGNIPRTLHSESGVSASTVTQTVTNDMIANGTIKFAKVDSTEFVKLTMSTTDISAGSALAKNTLYGVYS